MMITLRNLFVEVTTTAAVVVVLALAGFGFLEATIAALAKAVGRPVRMAYTRMEEFGCGDPAPQSLMRVKIGARKDEEEFLPAPAAREVDVAQALLQQRGEVTEERVSCRMAVPSPVGLLGIRFWDWHGCWAGGSLSSGTADSVQGTSWKASRRMASCKGSPSRP